MGSNLNNSSTDKLLIFELMRLCAAGRAVIFVEFSISLTATSCEGI